MAGASAGHSRLVLLVTAVGIAVAVIAVTWWRRPAGSPDTEGPVEFLAGTDEVSTAAFRASVGEQMVFGGNVVTNRGKQPATLTGASLQGDVAPSAARVVGLRVLDPKTNGMELIGAGPWPFEDYAEKSQPLDSYTLPPGHDAELLFIVEVHEEGAWHWPETRVEYTVEGQEHVAVTTFGFMACAPRRQPACD